MAWLEEMRDYPPGIIAQWFTRGVFAVSPILKRYILSAFFSALAIFTLIT